MSTRDPRVDAYIAKAPAFARPILAHLRDVVHAGCPEVVETIKWSSPNFTYEGMMCGMAAFKEHCAFSFWHSLVVPAEKLPDEASAGQFGRITRLEDLPPKRTLIGYVKEAARLNAEGVKAPNRIPKPKPALATPPEFSKALAASRPAGKAFEAFSPSARRDYVEWIIEARTPATRERRIATAVAWIAEGKRRNWKYEKC